MSKTKTEATIDTKTTTTVSDKQLTCGVVMPISAIDGCSMDHWTEVKEIIYDAIKSAGYIPNLVSDADDSGIIQKRIIQNLYNNDIVIVDVSAKNPNVMFELGIRLAFDKPTIIIKDNETDYTFDTSVIEHITYPRTLRFSNIIDFKYKLKEKIIGTIKAADSPKYTTFLKHFGEFKVAGLEEKEIGKEEFILKSISQLNSSVDSVKQILTEMQIQKIARAVKTYSDPEEYLLEQAVSKYIVERNIVPFMILESDEMMSQLVNQLSRNSKFHIFSMLTRSQKIKKIRLILENENLF